jgi:diadenosine tetraphosphate (Ap4A) HIT family hydrolase
VSDNDYQDGCVFCDRIAKGEYDSSTSGAVIFEPLNPVVPGHVLAVPKKHAASAAVDPFGAGDAIEAAAYYLSMHDGMEANLITSIGPDATQTVFHTHVHIVPRYKNDGVVLPWTEQQKTLSAASAAATLTRKFKAQKDLGDGHALDRNGRQWRVLEVEHGLNSDATIAVLDAHGKDVIGNGWPVFYFAPNTTTIHLAYPECQDLTWPLTITVTA